MSKVLTIHGSTIDASGAREDVLSTIREALEEAQRGEIECIAILKVSPGKTTSSAWSGSKHMLMACAGYFQIDLHGSK